MGRVAASHRLRSEHVGERQAEDWYQEPVSATEALLRAESFQGMYVYDPAAGEGNVLNACAARGITAFGSDIVKRTDSLRITTPRDFLRCDPCKLGCTDAIITNPPYRHAEAFVRMALKVTVHKVAILGRLAFLEGQRRGDLFDTTPLARVLVFRSRISMPPGGQGIEPKGGAVAYAWFVWRHGHVGPPTIGWLP